MPEENSTLVFSTDSAIPKKKDADLNISKPTSAARPKTIIRLDRKGRGGKTVTVIEGLQLSAKDSEKLLKHLKTKLGTGGTVKDSWIEIQGDHIDAVMAELAGLGYRPKRSGV